MVFKKGQGGRPKGSTNKKAEQWKNFEDWMMVEGMARLRAEMSKLHGEDFIRTMKDLLEYFQPKLARTENINENYNQDIDISVPTEIDEVIEN